jgi:hypothetical protein
MGKQQFAADPDSLESLRALLRACETIEPTADLIL